MRRNILFFILVIALSFVLAPYFGVWYDRIDFQYGGWMTSKEDAVMFVGFILAYVFLIPFIFKLFRANYGDKWIGWLVSPVILVYAGYNWRLIYVPVILVAVGFILAKLINIIISKFKSPQLR